MPTKSQRLAPARAVAVSAAVSRAFDEEIAEETAARLRTEAKLSGPPTRYELALGASLNRMTRWVQLGKFAPSNEEDVQCFLYHALVLELETALPIHAKPTHSKPEKLEFSEGKLLVKDMHFPDLIIGDPKDADAIYVEIKFRRMSRKSFHGRCLADVKKLAQHHSTHRQFFILFDCDPQTVYLNQKQRTDLVTAAAVGCTIWHHPSELTVNARKTAAEGAVATLRAKGHDFRAAGVQNAKKAIQGKAKVA